MSVELVMLFSHLILSCPLFLLPSVFPSIRVFSNESALCNRGPRYRSFSFSISPSNEYSRLISFRIDWFHLLAVKGPLKSLLQHHNLKASILWHSAFVMVQLSHLYIIIGKKLIFHYTMLVFFFFSSNGLCFCLMLHQLTLKSMRKHSTTWHFLVLPR